MEMAQYRHPTVAREQQAMSYKYEGRPYDGGNWAISDEPEACSYFEGTLQSCLPSVNLRKKATTSLSSYNTYLIALRHHVCPPRSNRTGGCSQFDVAVRNAGCWPKVWQRQSLLELATRRSGYYYLIRYSFNPTWPLLILANRCHYTSSLHGYNVHSMQRLMILRISTAITCQQWGSRKSESQLNKGQIDTVLVRSNMAVVVCDQMARRHSIVLLPVVSLVFRQVVMDEADILSDVVSPSANKIAWNRAHLTRPLATITRQCRHNQ